MSFKLFNVVQYDQFTDATWDLDAAAAGDGAPPLALHVAPPAGEVVSCTQNSAELYRTFQLHFS